MEFCADEFIAMEKREGLETWCAFSKLYKEVVTYLENFIFVEIEIYWTHCEMPNVTQNGTENPERHHASACFWDGMFRNRLNVQV